MIALGFGIGIFYGQVVSPVKLVDTNPTSLGIDYKADYVLMVSETFSIAKDANLSICQLANLGGAPKVAIEDATVFAVQNKFPPDDLVLMNKLYEAIKTYEFTGETCQ